MQIEDYADVLRGHRVLHLVGKGNKPAMMLEAVGGELAIEYVMGNERIQVT